MKRTYNYLVLCALALGSNAYGQTTSPTSNPTISYQGVLTGADHKPVPDKNYPITVHLYSDESRSHEIWQGSYDTKVQAGVFNIDLGSKDQPLPSASEFGGEVWLSVQIGDEAPMAPTRLSSVPQALTVADGAITPAKIAGEYVGSLSLNGARISNKAGNVNFVSGEGIDMKFDANRNAVVVNAGPITGNGKGGYAAQNTFKDVVVTNTTTLGSSSSDDITFNGTMASDINMGDNDITNAGNVHLGRNSAVTGQAVFHTSSNNSTATVKTAAQSANRTFTIPATSANANFVVSEGVQSINGTKTFNDGAAMGSTLSMGSNRITNVTNPTSAQDAATKSYTDAAVATEATTRSNADATESAARASADATEATTRANAVTTLQGNINTVTTNLNAEVAARGAAVTGEANTRSAADATLTTNLNTEIGNRTTADNTLTTNLNAEVTARGAAVTAEANTRSAADATLTTNLANEVTARTAAVTGEANTRSAADATLTTNLANEVTARTTAVTGEANTRSAADATLTTNLANEVTARGAAVTAEVTARNAAINTAVLNEVTARNAAITTATNTEVTNRNNAITAATNTEVTNRNNAITAATNTEVGNRNTAIASAVATEAANRTSADNALTASIAAADSRAIAAESALDASISAEAARAAAAEVTLDAGITAEAARATGAEGALGTAISDEATTRTDNDALMQYHIDYEDFNLLHTGNGPETVVDEKNFMSNVELYPNVAVGSGVSSSYFDYQGMNPGNNALGWYSDVWDANNLTAWLAGGAGIKIFAGSSLQAYINTTETHVMQNLNVDGNASIAGAVTVSGNNGATVSSGDVTLGDSTKGIVLYDSNGVAWRIRVHTDGSLYTEHP